MRALADNDPPGQTLDELSVESRTLLAFSIPTTALSPLLPRGWSICPTTQGSATGANFYLMVADRLLVQNGRGEPLQHQTTNRLAVMAVPATSDRTAGLMITSGFSARPTAAPGPYGVFVAAEITFRRQLWATACERIEEEWAIDSEDGCRVRIRLKFVRGTPVRSESRTCAFSALDPSLQRTYVADQGADTLQSESLPSARLQAVSVKAGGPRLQSLFDGSERLIAVTSLPWSIRRAFVPQAAGNVSDTTGRRVASNFDRPGGTAR